MLKKLSSIFVAGFLLNLVWENLHSYLYANYRGGAVTEKIILQATLLDAIFITLMAVLFLKISYFNERKWYALIFGFAVAVVVEIVALKSGYWAYNGFMPIIPILNTGLTPALQLGLISYLVFKRWL